MFNTTTRIPLTVQVSIFSPFVLRRVDLGVLKASRARGLSISSTDEVNLFTVGVEAERREDMDLMKLEVVIDWMQNRVVRPVEGGR